MLSGWEERKKERKENWKKHLLPHTFAFTLQKQVGYFNHRVVTLVAVKVERQWL